MNVIVTAMTCSVLCRKTLMNKKLTILHTEASDGWGGQEIRIFNEMLGMMGRGHRVMLAAPRHAKIYQRSKEAGVETFDVPMGRSSFASSVLQIAWLILKENVSIVNTHSSRDSWTGSIAGRSTCTRVVRSRHISSDLGRNMFTRFVYRNLNDAIITTGEFIKDQIVNDLGVDGAKVHPIPTGVDISRFGRADGSTLRVELGLSPGVPVLGIAAVMRGWKGHEFLLKAMPGVLNVFPDARLVVAGDGPGRWLVEHFMKELGIEDMVILLGHRDDVENVIAAFDVSILPSYASEGIPQFVLQSMASGKPVIGTTVGGIPEVVSDGVTGLLVPPKDPDAIADAAIKLLSDADMRKRMGDAGRTAVLERHTMDAMLDAVERLYDEVLAR